MEGFGFRDVAYIVGILLTGVITFLSTRHKIKELIRDKHDESKEQINNLKLEMKDLKTKDELQQQVIDQIGKQMEDLIPKLLNALSAKSNGSRK